ncbi:MAG: thioesterase family protein [Chitinophagaceae bacterium]|nr:thioesterase family protein [Chitinophagaceae bacterium]
MSRIKLQMPQQFLYSTVIAIRISDINYGNHVGNDAVLSLIHEARVQFLAAHGFSELQCGGVGLIMSDAGIEFKKEIFYGDVVTAHVAAVDFSSVGFDLYYKLETNGKAAVLAKTGMICYDYEKKKIAQVPEVVREKLGTN